MLVLLSLLACRSDPDPGPVADEGPQIVDAILVDEGRLALPLVRGLSFTSSEAALPTVTLTSDDHRLQFTGIQGTEHTLSLLGLRPDHTYDIEVRLVGSSGERMVEGPSVTSGSLPVDFPSFDVLAWEPERMEPGFTLINLTVPQSSPTDATTYLTVFDQDFVPVWIVSTDSGSGYSRWAEDGLWAINDGTATHFDPTGELDLRLVADNDEDPMPDIDIDIDQRGGLAYEVLPATDDTFWTVTYDTFDTDIYPLDADNPEAVANEQTLRDVVITELGYDGSVHHRFPLSERLDTQRVSYGSFNNSPQGLDWAHSNAVNYDPEGGLLVSSRHQDAVISLDEAGDVRWILSNPEGWRPEFEALRLQPVGDVSWPYHQHAPHVSDDGVLMMFDNGNQRYSPYDVPQVEPEPYTRVVGYRVDSDAMTVEQVFSFEETVTGPLFCTALGDADPQPQTGNVLATFGTVRGENGVTNEDSGRGTTSVRLIEFQPDTLDTVLDLRFFTPREVRDGGVRTFRADRVPVDQFPWTVLP